MSRSAQLSRKTGETDVQVLQPGDWLRLADVPHATAG